MKFFSEFKSCCWAASLPEPPNQVRPEENRPGPVRPRVKGSKERSVSLWKPALAAISEDSATLMVEQTRKRLTRSDEKLHAETGSMGETRNTGQKDKYRNPPEQMIIPTFSPTPFIF